jgi:hypothetical protein
MTLDFTTPGMLKINMISYVKKMLEDFPENPTWKTKYLWSKNQFKVNDTSTKLLEKDKDIPYLCKERFCLCKLAKQVCCQALYILQQESMNPIKAGEINELLPSYNKQHCKNECQHS